MKKNNSSVGRRDPDEKMASRRGAVLLTRWFPYLIVGVAGNSTCRSSRLS